MAKGDIDFSNLGGRPPAYETPEEMAVKIKEYFEQSKTPAGKYQPTIEGLTFHLGFSSRQSLKDYGEKEGFMDVVRGAKTFIKSCYERQLYGFAWAGSAFALKNLGKSDWQDEVIQHQNTTINKVEIVEKTRDAE